MAQSVYFEEHFSSDDIQEIFCERCDLEGTFVVAEGLCVTCADYMCQMCIKYHSQYKPDHDILAKSKMPNDVCFDRCSDHTGKLIKFFCECCSSFACSDCRRATVESATNEDHCWRHLPMLLVNFDNSNVHKLFKESLSEVKQKLRIMHKNADRRKILNDQCYERATKQLKHTIQKYSERLSAIKREFQDRFRTEKSHNDQNIQAITQDGENFDSEISEIENNVIKMRKLGRKATVFILEVQYQQKLLELNCILDKEKCESEIDTYIFEPKSVELMSENIGAFSVVPNKKALNIEIKYVDCINTGLRRLLIPSAVDCMCLVKGIFLVVVSYFCKTIKVFKVEKHEHKELFSYPQSEELFAVANVNDDQIAVSLFNKTKGWIYIFSVSDEGSLTKTSEIYTDTQCWGLAKYQNFLIVVHANPINSVNIMLLTGQIVKAIGKDTDGNALFRCSMYVALSLDKKKCMCLIFGKTQL